MNAFLSYCLAAFNNDRDSVIRVDTEAHDNWLTKVEHQTNISDDDLSEIDREEAHAFLHAEQWAQHAQQELEDE